MKLSVLLSLALASVALAERDVERVDEALSDLGFAPIESNNPLTFEYQQLTKIYYSDEDFNAIVRQLSAFPNVHYASHQIPEEELRDEEPEGPRYYDPDSELTQMKRREGKTVHTLPHKPKKPEIPQDLDLDDEVKPKKVPPRCGRPGYPVHKCHHSQ